jgi:hypothetical protein
LIISIILSDTQTQRMRRWTDLPTRGPLPSRRARHGDDGEDLDFDTDE